MGLHLSPAHLSQAPVMAAVHAVTAAALGSDVQCEDQRVYSTVSSFSQWLGKKQRKLGRHFTSKIPCIDGVSKRELNSAPGLLVLLSLNLFLNKGEIADLELFRKELASHMVSLSEDSTIFQSSHENLITISTRMVPNRWLGSDLERCRYYFDGYKMSHERWSERVAKFELQQAKEFGSSKPAERAALEMLSHSRTMYYRRRIKNPPAEFVGGLLLVDEYFQRAYQAIFGIRAPLDLSSRTFLYQYHAMMWISHADAIGVRSYICSDRIDKGWQEVWRLVMHEGLHLCLSDRCNDRNLSDLEEGFIEHCIWRMQLRMPSPFDHAIQPTGYPDNKLAIDLLCIEMPGLLRNLDRFFAEGDEESLRAFLTEHYTPTVRKRVWGYFGIGRNIAVLLALDNLMKTWST